MRLSDFDYALPDSFIAKDPANPRDSAKLLVFDSKTLTVKHCFFRDIVNHLSSQDVLVLNRSKVIKARILFDGCEIFLLKCVADNVYECLVKPGRKFKKGLKVSVKKNNGTFIFEILDILPDGTRVVRFHSDRDIESFGEAPFPPYIKGSQASLDDYQTVYAVEKGSVASPTAGLHFTDELLRKLKFNDVDVETVLLHVGLGTFLPVRTDDVVDHEMHSEFFQIDDTTTEKLNRAKNAGKNIVAVGTTSVRVLETSCEKGILKPKAADTNIFIYPGYQWKFTDKLITNFHLPKSTLIMLVASFIEYKCQQHGLKIDGTKKILELYEIAKKNEYRFFSFGDAMIII